MGTPLAQSDRCSTKASIAGSAQCMSSITSTRGPLAAIDSRKLRQAANDSSRSVCDPGFHDGLDRIRKLGRRLLGSVVLQDAGVRLDDLAEGPERDALAVRQAPALAPEDEVGLVVDEPLELPREPRLADAGLTRQR